jgi:2,4-dienoyl-CoA reductase-like NADH-dependent reductase (Old Yellow Enzyme family)
VNGLPDDVKRFIVENVRSVAQLEVLLLLRANPSTVWTAEAVSRELYTTPEMMAAQLDELQARGLLIAIETSVRQYRYQPKTEELDRLASELDRIYKERRVSVIGQIYAAPVDKVRTFADAFRLRKED